MKIGKLNLVDLAGSENIERSGATGKRATEAGKINKSLTTLGRVITALVEHRDHIPYRESNLTRLLQDSLGGRTKTTIIATISPAQCNYEETLSTLDYAHKAKSIRNKPEINQKLVKKALIREYTDEIDKLKRELWATREKNGVHLPDDVYQEMTRRADTQKEELRELHVKVQAMQDEMIKNKEHIDAVTQSLDERTEALAASERTLADTRLRLAHTETARDETAYLLGEHVSTEKRLWEQATTVCGMYDTASAELADLQTKLDALRACMTANRDAVDSYAHDTVDGMERMRNDEIDIRAENELLVDTLTHSIHASKSHVNTLIDERLRPELTSLANKQVRLFNDLGILSYYYYKTSYFSIYLS